VFSYYRMCSLTIERGLKGGQRVEGERETWVTSAPVILMVILHSESGAGEREGKQAHTSDKRIPVNKERAGDWTRVKTSKASVYRL